LNRVDCAAVALILAGHALADESGFRVAGEARRFAPHVASTQYSDARLTIAPDGRAALWFSRDRPGGAGGYDIWISRRGPQGWTATAPAPFNSPSRDFDPAYSADGRFVYFCSDRPGGLGADDLWRVRVEGAGFGEPEHLGSNVNSSKNEWAPMLSPDGRTLLFSSDGLPGANRMDLFIARLNDGGFDAATPVPGAINTPADEFDATFLGDGRAVVFARARDLKVDDVRLFHAVPHAGRYGMGALLGDEVNTPGGDTYAPMLDWSEPHSLTFTTRRPASSPTGADVYVVKYRP
jgi:hypothetical protein